MNDILADFNSSNNNNDILLVVPCRVSIGYRVNGSYNSEYLEHNVYIYSESISKLASDYANQHVSIVESIIQDMHTTITDSVHKTNPEATVSFSSENYDVPTSISVVSNGNYAFIYTNSNNKFTVFSKTYKYPIITNEEINFLSKSNVLYEDVPNVYFGIFRLYINNDNIFSTDPYFDNVYMYQTGIPVTNSKIVNFARILYLLRDTINSGVNSSYNSVSLSALTVTMLYRAGYSFLYTYDSTTDTGYNLCKNILNIEDLSTDIFGSTSMATLGNYSNSSGSYQRIIHNDYYLTIDLNADYTKNLYVKKKGQSSQTGTMNNKELNPLTYNGSKKYWNFFSKSTSYNYTKAPGNNNICPSTTNLPTGVPNQFYSIICPVSTGLFTGSDSVYNCNKTSLQWELVSNESACSRTHCGPLSLSDCSNGETLDKTAVGETASKTCENVKYTATCTNLGWSDIENETTGETLNPTVSLICKDDPTFPDTPAGSIATVSCPENYSGTMSKACLLINKEAVWDPQPNTLKCLATRCVPDSNCPDCSVTNVNEVAEYTKYIEKEPKRFYKYNYSVKCTPKGWEPVETVSSSRACTTVVFSDTVQYNGIPGDTHTFDCEDSGKYEVECSRSEAGVHSWVKKSTCENVKVPTGETGGSPSFSVFSSSDFSKKFDLDPEDTDPKPPNPNLENKNIETSNIFITWIKNNTALFVILVIIAFLILGYFSYVIYNQITSK